MSVIVLDKLVIHDGSDKQTVLVPGNVECVITIDGDGGQGINFMDVESMKEFLNSHPSDEISIAIQSALLTVQKIDPEFKQIDDIKGIELETPSKEATVKQAGVMRTMGASVGLMSPQPRTTFRWKRFRNWMRRSWSQMRRAIKWQ